MNVVEVYATVSDAKGSPITGLNRDAFLKFDTGPASGTLTSAKLRFYGKLSTAGTINAGVYSVPRTTWGESTATWSNSPKFSALLGSIKITSTTGGCSE